MKPQEKTRLVDSQPDFKQESIKDVLTMVGFWDEFRLFVL